MSFEPQKFFIGLMDFFSVLLPGALLSYFSMDWAGPAVLGYSYYWLDDTQGWIAFLFASYLIGHLAFLLGSWLDHGYDWVRHHTLNNQIALLAHHGRLTPRFLRLVIWMVFKEERNLAVECAARLKRERLGPLQAQRAMNTFQWCKTVLNADSPSAMAVVERFEASSKFFRTFVVVLAVLVLTWPLQRIWPWPGIAAALLLLVFALWRYMEQRYKATNQAYWSVITLASKDGKPAPALPTPAADGPARAGGLVFRLRGGRAEYLLVEAPREPARWTLPEEAVEAGEHPRETAVRAVYEATGAWACIAGSMGELERTSGAGPVTTRYFLMRALAPSRRLLDDRRYAWLNLQEALQRADTDATTLLLAADKQLQRARPQ